MMENRQTCNIDTENAGTPIGVSVVNDEDAFVGIWSSMPLMIGSVVFARQMSILWDPYNQTLTSCLYRASGLESMKTFSIDSGIWLSMGGFGVLAGSYEGKYIIMRCRFFGESNSPYFRGFEYWWLTRWKRSLIIQVSDSRYQSW